MPVVFNKGRIASLRLSMETAGEVRQQGGRAQHAENDDSGKEESLEAEASQAARRGLSSSGLRSSPIASQSLSTLGFTRFSLLASKSIPLMRGRAAPRVEKPLSRRTAILSSRREHPRLMIFEFLDEHGPSPVDGRLEERLLVGKVGIHRSRRNARPAGYLFQGGRLESPLAENCESRVENSLFQSRFPGSGH